MSMLRRRMMMQQAQNNVRHEIEINEARQINTALIPLKNNYYKVTDDKAIICFYDFRSSMSFRGYMLISEVADGVKIKENSTIYGAKSFTVLYGGKEYYVSSHDAARRGIIDKTTEEQMGCLWLNRVTGVPSYDTDTNSYEYIPAAKDLLDYYYEVI